MIWTESADILLVKLWNEGGTLTTVAEGMRAAGYEDVTPNTVAGRKHRLSPSLFTRPRKPPFQRSNTTVTITTTFQDNDSVPPPIKQKQQTGIAYHEMRDHHCRAILDSRGGPWDLPMICGEPRALDAQGTRTPYCLKHWRLYHQTTRR